MTPTETLRPLYDWVLVRIHDADEKTPGGIVIPETSRGKGKPWECTVLARGNGRFLSGSAERERQRVVPQVEPGDRVLVERNSGQDVDLGDGVKRRAVREIQCMAVIT